VLLPTPIYQEIKNLSDTTGYLCNVLGLIPTCGIGLFGWSRDCNVTQMTGSIHSGRSCHTKPFETKFEPNQTDVNGFNQFQFRFWKFCQKPNSLVSGLEKKGLNQTKPNFPNTSISCLCGTQSASHCVGVMDCHTSYWLSTNFWWTNDLSTNWFDWLKDWFTYNWSSGSVCSTILWLVCDLRPLYLYYLCVGLLYMLQYLVVSLLPPHWVIKRPLTVLLGSMKLNDSSIRIACI